MIEILVIMFSGIILGYIFRRRRSIITIADKLAGWSIYLLLFLLGLSIGNNEMIINNFAQIGFNSILLTISGITGSVLLSFIAYKFFFKKDETL
ncbi:MAG TPA: LysO family transporter [Spirochaetota bacterium]|nr:LysO family transporter [Spirochaetota bacterium]HPS85808.1 LysO family transporter [Spirochaetota bacterium]